MSVENTLVEEKHNKWIPILIAFLSAFVFITLCSESSPLYVVNYNVDVQIFFTIGKSIVHGSVPYLDLFDQKGPILYFLFALGALISETSFIGIWIIEIICATIFLYLCWKIICLFYYANPIWIVIIGAIIYSSEMLMWGGEGEEFCLPALAYTFYVGLKCIKMDKPISIKEGFIIGLTSGCIFWFKFTIIGFYIGFAIIILILRIKKDGRKLILPILFLLLGVMIITAIVFIYFGCNHALNDLFEVYFYDNFTAYAKSNAFIAILKGFETWVIQGLFSFIGFILAILFCAKKHKNMIWYISAIAFCYFVPVFIGGRHYSYYLLPFYVFFPLGIALVDSNIKKLLFRYSNLPTLYSFLGSKQWKIIYSSFFCIVAIIYATFIPSWSNFRSYKNEDLAQYQFAKIINEKENSTLLNYGFLDSGFYFFADKVPTFKYFCATNLKVDEMEKEQLKAIQNQEFDFIVALYEPDELYETNYVRNLIDNEEEMYTVFDDYGYKFVDTFYDDIYEVNYYLYELKK